MATPAAAVMGVIEAALPSEVVRTGFEQQDPDRGIWVSQAGGLPSTQISGVAETIEQPRVRVLVRTGPREHDVLEALVASVRAAVNRIAPTGYISSTPQPATEPRIDALGRPFVTFRVALAVVVRGRSWSGAFSSAFGGATA